MKRGTFVVFAILILIFSSVSVNADLVDWFTQDHAGSLSNENKITGISFFSGIGNWFKGLFGGVAGKQVEGVNCDEQPYYPGCEDSLGDAEVTSPDRSNENPSSLFEG